MCVRDHHGKIVVIRTDFYGALYVSYRRRGLGSCCSNLLHSCEGHQNVIFVIYCKTIVIKSNAMDNSELGQIVQHCWNLLLSNPSYVIGLQRDKLMT